MRRIRLLFLGLSLVVLVAMALLLHRAAASVALERQMRHGAVAERIFDEMERALSDFLAREEARPFDGLAGPAAAPPFVLGHFSIEADGRVETDARGGRTTEEAIERAVGRYARHGRAAAPAQLPGTTVGLAGAEPAEKPAPVVAPEARKVASKDVSTYDALRALNKGVLQRAERQKAQALADEAKEPPASPGRRDAATNAFEAGLPPMSGRVVDADHLVLQRTVARGERAFREGVVLDVKQLGAWLTGQALGSDGLAAHARISYATPGEARAGADGDFVYSHRFADPFADVTARLALATLPGVGSAGWVYGLSAALVVAALLGLVALYRMVSVTVAFAERRSDFVAAVSHELKTPLTAIRMYGEMLRDGIVASDAKRQEYYRHITAESERLSRLINNVLEFARLENGGRDVTPVGGPVEPVVREAVELLRPHLDAHGFALDVEADTDLPPARFERDALLQVLFNLVDNAVKYADGGDGRRIVVRVERGAPGVRIVVRDHGPGVPARHLAHVFDPFYRGERELTRRSKGTGLGLALVRGLVERMGGRVAGRNAPGGGFEVTIALGVP